MNKENIILATLLFLSVAKANGMKKIEEWSEENQATYQAETRELEQLHQFQRNGQMCSSPRFLFFTSQVLNIASDFALPKLFSKPSTLVNIVDFSIRTGIPLCCFAGGKLADKYFAKPIEELEKKLEKTRPPSKVEILLNRIEILEEEFEILRKRQMSKEEEVEMLE